MWPDPILKNKTVYLRDGETILENVHGTSGIVLHRLLYVQIQYVQ